MSHVLEGSVREIAQKVAEQLYAKSPRHLYSGTAPEREARRHHRAPRPGFRCPRDHPDAARHQETIRRVDRAYPEEIDTLRLRTSRRMRRVVSDQLDRLEENPWIIGLASGNNFLMPGDGPNSAPVIDADVGSAADLRD
jgi:hypothetical protein